MTVFRILPNGHRRRLPDGSVRALGQNGPRYFDVGGSTSVGVATGAMALPAIPMIGQAWVSFALTGQLTQAGTVGHTELFIGASGVLSGSINLRSSTLIGVDLVGNLIPAVRLYGSTGITMLPAGRLINSLPIAGVAPLGIHVSGRIGIASAMRGGTGVAFGVSGSISAKAGKKWMALWVDVYDARQAVLDAIDENSRNLAKEAGGVANAAANAIVQTNVRVEEIEGIVVADSQRVTLLTTKVQNVEGTQTAQGTAISNLQTTSAQHGNTLTSQSQQLTSVSSSISTLDGKVLANANATTALDSRVSINEQGVTQAKATWGVYLTAGNLISGVQSINDGVISEFNVSAHVFRLLSPAGADGMEIQQGYIRVWKGNSQRIIGNGFGANNDLMDYFGPNVGVANASKSNAVMYMDKNGNAYWGGSLSAGVLRNAAQSTQISAGAIAEIGVFTTNGRQKTVTYSLAYNNTFMTASNLGGNAPLSATLILERSTGGGAWGEVSRRGVIGQREFVGYEPGDGYIYAYNIGGSSTFTDNTPGTSATFNYRVRMESVVGWPFARPEGGPNPWGTQSLSVLSIEE
jgi:hypothetical protein